MADFQLINCIRFGHRQEIHIHLSIQALARVLDNDDSRQGFKLFHVSVICWTEVAIAWFKLSQPFP